MVCSYFIFFVASTISSTLFEASVAQENSSYLQRQAFMWLIARPHSLILLHQAFEKLSSFRAAVTEEMLWLLKLCQLPHYRSHNSGKADRNDFLDKRFIIHELF